jgi:hypothetical protein
VFLRRDSSALVLMATALRGGRADSIGDAPARAALVHSPAPDSVQVLERRTVRADQRVVLHGEITTPGIMGVEYLVGARGLAGARTRFGVATPPSLAGLARGACAISEPMLVEASALTGGGIEDAYRGLLDDLELRKPRKLGLMWESYGIASTDSVTVSITVASVGEIGRLRRLGMAVGVADDPTVSITVRWTEPRPGISVTAVAARVPTLLRQLTLDVSRLRAGEYVVDIAMESPRCTGARAERAFSITR